MAISSQHPEVINVSASALSAIAAGLFDARLQYDGTTQISLQAYKGRYVAVTGEFVDVSSGLTCLTTSNLITSTGANSGSSTAVNTLYYVYVSGSAASYAPSSLRLSATAPSTVNGVRMLGSSGNALNWRFVGWVRTISNAGTPNFADNIAQRLVVNYYNRRRIEARVCPGYVNDDQPSVITLPTTSSAWVALNGGSGSKIQYIDPGEQPAEGIIYTAYQMTAPTGNGDLIFGFGLDTTTAAQIHHSDITKDGANLRPLYEHLQVTSPITASEGYHELNFLGFNDFAQTVTLYADGGRAGTETVDAECTYMVLTFWG